MSGEPSSISIEDIRAARNQALQRQDAALGLHEPAPSDDPSRIAEELDRAHEDAVAIKRSADLDAAGDDDQHRRQGDARSLAEKLGGVMRGRPVEEAQSAPAEPQQQEQQPKQQPEQQRVPTQGMHATVAAAYSRAQAAAAEAGEALAQNVATADQAASTAARDAVAAVAAAGGAAADAAEKPGAAARGLVDAVRDGLKALRLGSGGGGGGGGGEQSGGGEQDLDFERQLPAPGEGPELPDDLAPAVAAAESARLETEEEQARAAQRHAAAKVGVSGAAAADPPAGAPGDGDARGAGEDEADEPLLHPDKEAVVHAATATGSPLIHSPREAARCAAFFIASPTEPSGGGIDLLKEPPSQREGATQPYGVGDPAAGAGGVAAGMAAAHAVKSAFQDALGLGGPPTAAGAPAGAGDEPDADVAPGDFAELNRRVAAAQREAIAAKAAAEDEEAATAAAAVRDAGADAGDAAASGPAAAAEPAASDLAPGVDELAPALASGAAAAVSELVSGIASKLGLAGGGGDAATGEGAAQPEEGGQAGGNASRYAHDTERAGDAFVPTIGPEAAGGSEDGISGAIDAVKRGWDDLQRGGEKAPFASGVPGGADAARDAAAAVQRARHLDDPQQRRIYEGETNRIKPVSSEGRQQQTPPQRDAAVQPQQRDDDDDDQDGGGGGLFSFIGGTGSAATPRGRRGASAASIAAAHAAVAKAAREAAPGERLEVAFGAPPPTEAPAAAPALARAWRGFGRAAAKDPSGKEMKDEQQLLVREEPASGRMHVVGNTAQEGLPAGMTQERPPVDAALLESKVERLGAAARDFAAGPPPREKGGEGGAGSSAGASGGEASLWGKDSAGKPAGVQALVGDAARGVADRAARAPESAAHAAGAALDIVSGLTAHAAGAARGVASAAAGGGRGGGSGSSVLARGASKGEGEGDAMEDAKRAGTAHWARRAAAAGVEIDPAAAEEAFGGDGGQEGAGGERAGGGGGGALAAEEGAGSASATAVYEEQLRLLAAGDQRKGQRARPDTLANAVMDPLGGGAGGDAERAKELARSYHDYKLEHAQPRAEAGAAEGAGAEGAPPSPPTDEVRPSARAYDPVGHMRESKEADAAKLPAQPGTDQDPAQLHVDSKGRGARRFETDTHPHATREADLAAAADATARGEARAKEETREGMRRAFGLPQTPEGAAASAAAAGPKAAAKAAGRAEEQLEGRRATLGQAVEAGATAVRSALGSSSGADEHPAARQAREALAARAGQALRGGGSGEEQEGSGGGGGGGGSRGGGGGGGEEAAPQVRSGEDAAEVPPSARGHSAEDVHGGVSGAGGIVAALEGAAEAAGRAIGRALGAVRDDASAAVARGRERAHAQQGGGGEQQEAEAERAPLGGRGLPELATETAERADAAAEAAARDAAATAGGLADDARGRARGAADAVTGAAERADEAVSGAAEDVGRSAKAAREAAGQVGAEAADAGRAAKDAAGDAAERARERAAAAADEAASTGASLLSELAGAAKAALGVMLGPLEREGAFDESAAVFTDAPTEETTEPTGIEQAMGSDDAPRAAGAGAGECTAHVPAAPAPAGAAGEEEEEEEEESQGKGRVLAALDDAAASAGYAAGHAKVAAAEVAERARRGAQAVVGPPPGDVPSEPWTDTETVIAQRAAEAAARAEEDARRGPARV